MLMKFLMQSLRDGYCVFCLEDLNSHTCDVKVCMSAELVVLTTQMYAPSGVEPN